MANEIELKYALPYDFSESEIFSSVSGLIYGDIKTIEMHSIYFDTKDNLLAASRTSLRLRRENDLSVVTVKTPKDSSGALANRGEWQVEADSISSALPELSKTDSPEIIFSFSENELVVVAEFSFTRKMAYVKAADFEAELCVDIGYLSPDGKLKAPLCELEIELKSGDVSALCKFGDELCTKFSLKPEFLSKLTRARNLK